MPKPPPDIRRKEPARQRSYKNLSARVAALEDTISHFYNVIKEIQNRVAKLHDSVSVLEKKSRPEGKQGN